MFGLVQRGEKVSKMIERALWRFRLRGDKSFILFFQLNSSLFSSISSRRIIFFKMKWGNKTKRERLWIF